MDALINQWLNDPDLLMVAGGGLLLIGLLLIILLLRRRQAPQKPEKSNQKSHPLASAPLANLAQLSPSTETPPNPFNPFGDTHPKTKPYAPFPHKPFEVEKPSGSMQTFLNQSDSEDTPSARDKLAPMLKTEQALSKITRKPENPDENPLDDVTAENPATAIQPLTQDKPSELKSTKSKSFFDLTRMPMSGDLLLSLIQKGTRVKASPNFEGLIKQDTPEPQPNQHLNKFINKIRSTFMGKVQLQEDIDRTPPALTEYHESAPNVPTIHEDAAPSASNAMPDDTVQAPTPAPAVDQGVAAAMLAQESNAEADKPTVDETQFPPAGDTLLNLLKSHKHFGDNLTTVQPQIADRFTAPVFEAMQAQSTPALTAMKPVSGMDEGNDAADANINMPSFTAIPKDMAEALPTANAYLASMIANSANIMKEAEALPSEGLPKNDYTKTRYTQSTAEATISSTKPEAVFEPIYAEVDLVSPSAATAALPAAPTSDSFKLERDATSALVAQPNETLLPPSAEEPPLVALDEQSDHPSKTTRAFSMLPFNIFKKATQSPKDSEPSLNNLTNFTQTPAAEPVLTLPTVTNSSLANVAAPQMFPPAAPPIPPKHHLAPSLVPSPPPAPPVPPINAQLPTILRPTQELNNDRQAMTLLMPRQADDAYEDDRFDSALEQLEREAQKTLEGISLQNNQSLPPLLQGLVLPVQTMMNQAQAEALLQSLAHQQFGHARSHLNEIINKQTEIFQAWRRSFGKFSRLFSVIAMNEDWQTAYKSMKKATELDPTESWNWYVLGLIAAQLQQPDEHAALLDKALSVAVAEVPTLTAAEALKRSPKEGAENVFVCAIVDKATLSAAKAAWAEAKMLLTALLTYFQNHPPKTPYLQDHRLKSALRLAQWQQNSKAYGEAVNVLTAALAEMYCQAQVRLKILLTLIELRHEAKVSQDIREQWFHEGTALILSFPQHHVGGAKYYRVLANYHLDHGAFDQAEPLFQSALKLDQTHRNDVDEAHDWHGLAQVAKARKQPQAAFDCWQHAYELMKMASDLQRFPPRLQAEVHLAIGEMLLESNQMPAATPHLEKGAAQLVLLAPSLIDGQRLAHLGALLFVRKQYPLSQNLYQAAKTLLQQDQRSAVYCEVILSLAHCLFYMKDFSASEVALKEAQSLLKQTTNPLRSAQAFVLMGLIDEVLQKPHKALDSCHEALAQLKPLLGAAQQSNMSEISPILKTVFACMGRCYLQMGHNQATKMLRNALVYCLPKDEERLDIERHLALALLNQNDNAEALDLLESCLQGASQRNDVSMQWDVSVQMARGLMRLGSLDRAEGLLRQVHEQSKMAGDAATQAKTAGAFGELYLAKNEIDTALTFYQQAVQFHKKANQPLEEANEQVKWAEVLIKHGRGQEAEPLLKQAEKVLTQLGAERKAAETLIALAKILLKQNRGEESEGYYQRAVGLWERLDAPERAAEELASLGILKMRRGKHSDAKKDWLKAKQIFQQLGKHESALNVNHWLEMLGEAP